MARRFIKTHEISDKHIFDTSAVNWLFDDTSRDELVETLQSKEVLPTTLSISEIAATDDEARRHGLLELLQRIAGENWPPLASPNQLIIRACQGYSRRDPTLSLNDGDEEKGALAALKEPAAVDAEAQRLALQYHDEREAAFKEMYEGIRGEYQAAFRSGVERPRSFRALIDYFRQKEDLIYPLVNAIYERAVGKMLPPSELKQLLDSLPHWRMFLMSYAHALYRRAIREQGYGRKNAGNMDLWSATYLPSCDYFITADKRQRRALRIINQHSSRAARILSYTRWKETVLCGGRP
jgi:hypothetical protein